MTDAEYRKFLHALAQEYLRTVWMAKYRHPLECHRWLHAYEEISKAGALASVAADRPTNETLTGVLIQEIEGLPWWAVTEALDETGAREAFSAYGVEAMREFRRSVLPEEERRILQQAGIRDPDAVLLLMETRARQLADRAEGNHAIANLPEQGREELTRATNRLGAPNEPDGRRRRKWFKGITRILAGGAGAIGNVLLGLGTLPSGTPVGGAAVLGSCTGALVLIGDGVEALRGE